MRILLLTDIHGNTERLQKILDEVGDVDFVLAAGDITDFGSPEDASEVAEMLKGKAPTLAVPGNCDPEGVPEALDEAGVLVDDRIREMGEYQVVGIGGSNLTPFDTPREFTEEELAKRLELAAEAEEPWVLLSHAPPHNTVDITQNAHVGSESVRKTVEKEGPVLAVSGHVHEAKGDMYLNGSFVVNPGAAMKGSAAIVELNGEPDVQYVRVK